MSDLPTWLTASGLLGAFLFGVLSAYFPPLNAEVYAIAAPVVFPHTWVIHVVVMTCGLVAGKVTHYLAAVKGAAVLSQRRGSERKDSSPTARRRAGPVRSRLVRWSRAMIDVVDRPRLGPLVILASAGVGFPPLALVTVAAGIKRVPLWTFIGVTVIGCLARFLVTSWLVMQGVGIGD